MFQSESTLYSCLNVKELLTQNKRDIWNLSDSNGIETCYHLVRKRTLNHWTKLTKWLSFRLQAKWLWARISLLCYIVIIFFMFQVYQYHNITFPSLYISHFFQLNYRLFSKVKLNSNKFYLRDLVSQILTSHVVTSFSVHYVINPIAENVLRILL